MSALARDGVEFSGVGLAAVREAIAMGVRVPLPTYVAIEDGAALLGEQNVFVVFDDAVGLVSLHDPANLPIELRRELRARMRAGGLRRWREAWVLETMRETVRANPRKSRR